MKKRVLITGASGFVGYHLIEEALASGLDVYAAVRSSSNTDHLSEFNIQYTNPDFSSVDLLKKEIEEKNYSYIIHAAGITKAKTQAEYNTVNAEYTRNLGLAVVAADVSLEKFVFVSSLAALGPLKALSGQIQDDTVPNPVTAYGASKVLAEQYLADIPNLPLLVIRPTAVYGPREKDIFILFQSINKGLEPYIGNFEQRLSFIYVKDLAAVIVKGLSSPVEHKNYNISDGEVYSRYALGDISKKLLSKKTLKFHLPISVVNFMAGVMDLVYAKSKETPALNKEKMNELTAVNWACNINNAKLDLRFAPKFNLEAGLTETLKWYKTNHWLN